MSLGHTAYPQPANEPVFSYLPGSAERTALKQALKELKSKEVDIPMYIGNDVVRTGQTMEIRAPHELKQVLGKFHEGDDSHVEQAINAALAAKESWGKYSWENRAAIFLKAADLLTTKYRGIINAATMLGQSKTVMQAELDSACELIDFLRFNVHYLSQIYAQQPISSAGIQNRVEYRPLEGFVLAITPFNFTAIGGNLPTSAALCGNVVVWKPAYGQVYSAYFIMKVLQEAGLPNGVINLIYVDGPALGKVCFEHKAFAGIHFTGSTAVFNTIWETIGRNLNKYTSYPRIVGETGGKDFVVVHPSAQVDVTVTALLRGAFEFQGQKCSAASRAYLPSNLSDEILQKVVAGVESFKMGSTEDFRNFITAVIDENSFNKITAYIENAKKDERVTVLVGGTYDKTVGYFISPTVLLTTDPDYVTMHEEIFGPVLTVYVYDAGAFESILSKVDRTSKYALTGAIISTDRTAVELAIEKLRNAAGNFYINDKPTGAVVGQQPFGGARGSGTNDKAGSILNLYRWLSVRTIKENFTPPTDYRYGYMVEE